MKIKPGSLSTNVIPNNPSIQPENKPASVGVQPSSNAEGVHTNPNTFESAEDLPQLINRGTLPLIPHPLGSETPKSTKPMQDKQQDLGAFRAGHAQIIQGFVPGKKPDTPDSKRKDLLHKQLLKTTHKARKSPDGKEAHQTFEQVSKLLKKQEFSKASELLNTRMEDGSLELQLSMTKGLGTKTFHATKTLQKQLSFAAKMQSKGIKTSFPPTETQLQNYFSTFKKDVTTRKEALKAFEAYTDAFHAHSAHIDGKMDVVYSKDKSAKVLSGKLYMPGEKGPKPQKGDYKLTTAVPDTFAEVTKKRTIFRLSHGSNAGKYANDCEGFAYMTEKLLSSAGFDVKHVVASGKSFDHVMSAVKDPETGQQIVSSNGKIFDYESELLKKSERPGHQVEAQRQLKEVRQLPAAERLKKSLTLAIRDLSGGEGGAQLHGKYYIGDTIQKAELYAQVNDPSKRL